MVRTVSFDVDGVIAGGEWIPAWERHPKNYRELPILSKDVAKYLPEIATWFNVYFVSSRYFDNATRVTKEWLEDTVPRIAIAGVITGEEYSRLDRKAYKGRVVQALNPLVHVDDEPAMLEYLPPKKRVYFKHPSVPHWPDPDQIAKRCRAAVTSWRQLYGFFSELRKDA